MNDMDSNSRSVHKTVLLHEVIQGLSIKKGEVILDATINGGGHATEIAKEFGDSVTILGTDLDKDALKRASTKLQKDGAKFFLDKSNFKDIDVVLKKMNFSKIDKAIFDLGISSDQLEVSGRGFSFQKDEPLLMTLKDNPKSSDLTAYDVVNSFSQENLEIIIRGFGEENFAGRIARHIVEHRALAPIKSSYELAEIIKNAVPFFKRKGKIHPATKTFQAIRIAVNGELDAISEGLSKTFEHLNNGGRMAVISFHSLEDRIVKKYFKELEKENKAILMNKKPITSGEEELKENPRARSAKLRIIEKII